MIRFTQRVKYNIFIDSSQWEKCRCKSLRVKAGNWQKVENCSNGIPAGQTEGTKLNNRFLLPAFKSL